jgi:hypothetical protein
VVLLKKSFQIQHLVRMRLNICLLICVLASGCIAFRESKPALSLKVFSTEAVSDGSGSLAVTLDISLRAVTHKSIAVQAFNDVWYRIQPEPPHQVFPLPGGARRASNDPTLRMMQVGQSETRFRIPIRCYGWHIGSAFVKSGEKLAFRVRYWDGKVASNWVRCEAIVQLKP